MSWRDQIAGARMTVDQEFSDRVMQSQFSRQQWGLIMTAVEFDVEKPDDPDAARMVADTSKLEHVLPELDNVEQGMGGMGGPRQDRGGSGGVVDSLKGLLGLDGDGPDAEREAAAESLAQEYAAELQAHLESEGRWESVRTAATGEQSS